MAIIATERDYPLLERHWPYFKSTGFAILGCGTEDRKTRWPERVQELNTGKLGTKMTPAGSAIFGLVEQEIDIWKHFLDQTTHDSLCIVEADNLFVKPPPATHPLNGSYCVTVLPNRSPDGLFNTSIYFSTPRWSDRQSTGLLYCFGRQMFLRGDHEHYMSDRFPALVALENGIPIIGLNTWSPSTNAINDGLWLHEAETAIRNGAWCLHSVKHEWQLKALKGFIR